MHKKPFNWTVFLGILTVMFILAVSAFILRQWQNERVKNKALQTGLESYNECKWESAASNMGRYLAFCPVDVDVLLKYADAHLHIRPAGQENLQQAIAAYRAILRTDKTNKTAVTKLSGIYLQMNIAAEAEIVINRYLQYHDDADIKTLLAISLARQRKYQQAAELLKKIILDSPAAITAYEVLSSLAESNYEGLYENAEYWLNQCIKNNPLSAHAFISRAAFFLHKNKPSAALRDLANAEVLDLSDPNRRIEIAYQYIKAELFLKAKGHFDRIEKINPTMLSLWQGRAIIALDEDSKTEMLDVANNAMKALKKDPWDFMPIAAELMIKGGDLAAGRKYIEILKQKGINPPAAEWLQGLIAQAEGKDYEAIKTWDIAQKMGYDSEKITPELINALLRVGDNESALMILRRKTAEQPERYKWHIQLGNLAFEEQLYTEALQHSKKAMSLIPNSAEPLILNMKVRICLPGGSTQISRCEKFKNITEELSNLDGLQSNLPEIELFKFTCSLECEDFEKAEIILNDLQSSQPGCIEIEAAYVDLLLAKNMNVEAEAKLFELINQFPQDIVPVTYLSDVLVKDGKSKQSETIILDALVRIEDYQVKRKLAILLADIYKDMNEAEKERSFLCQMLQEMPNDIPLRKKLLDLYLNEKQYYKAQILIDEIKKLEGSDGRQWKYQQAKLWYSDVYFENHYHQIIALLQQNLADNPYDNASRLLLASVYETASENQLALITYRAALNHRPYDIEVKTHIIDALFKVKEYDTAEKLLDEAIKQDYVNGDVLKLNLRNLLRQNKISDAIEFLEKIDAPGDSKKNISLLIACLKIKQKEYDTARQMLNDLAAQDPNSLQVKSLLVELNIRTNNNSQALELCSQIIAETQQASSLLLRAHTYAAIGRVDYARNDFNRAVTMEPNNADVWEARGLFFRSIGKFEQAFNDLEKAYQLQLSNIDIVKYMLKSLPDINNSFNVWKCQQLLKHALVNYPKDPELLWYKARLLIAENKLPSLVHAENILDDITRDNPHFSSGWSLLAEIYMSRNETGKAMDTILQGLKYCRQDKTLLLLKAKTEMLISPEMAVLTLELLNERLPDDIDIVILLANTYISAGQNQQAIKLLSSYEQKSSISQTEKIGTALAIAMYKSGEKEQAWEKLQQLSISNQNSCDISAAKCEILYCRQDWEGLKNEFDNLLLHNPECTEDCLETIKTFLTSKNPPPPSVSEYLLRQILKYKPDYPHALQLLAVNLHINEQLEAAKEFYEKLIKTDPNNKIAINNLAWILCENYNKYQKALEFAEYGLKIHPDYASLRDTRGLIYYRLGEYKKASQDFLESMQLNDKKSPSYVVSLFHLGRTLHQMGNAENAYAYMEKAISLNQIQGGLSINEAAEAQNILLTFLPNKSYATDSDK